MQQMVLRFLVMHREHMSFKSDFIKYKGLVYDRH